MLRFNRSISDQRDLAGFAALFILFAASLAFGVSDASSDPADGSIVFESDRGGQHNLWITDANGSNLVQLTDDKVEDVFPAWSPDGAKIAWTRGGRSPEGEIWVISDDGTGATRLTSNAASDLNASWSPDGSQIAFRSRRDGNNEIYVMNADGSDETRLTNDPASDFAPDWSPNGDRIAFTRDGPAGIAVYTMGTDGGDLEQVTDFSLNAGPAGWSPDGTRLLTADAFCATCTTESDLFAINADGTGLAQLTDTPENEIGKSWSPGGSHVVYDRSRLTGSHLHKGEIFALELATGETTNLTNTLSISEEHPDWSP